MENINHKITIEEILKITKGKLIIGNKLQKKTKNIFAIKVSFLNLKQPLYMIKKKI